MITITADALNYIERFLREEAERNDLKTCMYDFKILIEKSGCGGKTFKFYPIKVYEICEGELQHINYLKFRIWYKKEDKDYVIDSVIQLKKEQLGNRIEIINDKIPKYCGCGKSFSL